MDVLNSDIFRAALVGFVVTAVLGYVYRSAGRAGHDHKLSYGPEVKAIGWVCAIVAVACIAGAFLVSSETDKFALALGAAMFGVMGVYLLGETYSTHGFFDDEQISLSTWWRRPKRGRWADLRSARFKKNGQYFELVFANQTRIKFSKALRGHRAICDHVQLLGFRVDGLESESLTG